MRLKVCLLWLCLTAPELLHADEYQIYFTDNAEITSNGQYVNYVKIINTSSYTTFEGNLSGYYSQTFAALDAAATTATGLNYASAMVVDLSSAPVSVLDFTGTNLKLRTNRGLGLDPVGVLGDNYWYDVVNNVDLNTGEVVETILIASSQTEFNIARAAGYNVILDSSSIDRATNGVSFTSFSTNVTNENDTSSLANNETMGGLVVEQISGIDGASIFRQEADGTVHIGENSIVLSDESVSQSGNDEVYSSSGVLQLGNDDNHRTVVRGTLEVSTPTQSNHAANKGYVDTQDAATLVAARSYADTQDAATLTSARSYADTQDAATLTSARSYADTQDATTLQSAKVYANGVAAMSMAASQISFNADPQAPIGLGIGFGNIGDQSAFAIGLTGYNQKSGVRYSFTASHNATTKQTGIGAGVFFSLR